MATNILNNKDYTSVPKFIAVGLICLVFVTSFISCSTVSHSLVDDTQNYEIYVIGTAHKNHLMKSLGYTLSNLSDQISSLKPELICGEIYSRDYMTNMKGYYPPEQAVVEYTSKKINAIYVPADWRGDYREMDNITDLMTKDEVSEFSKTCEVAHAFTKEELTDGFKVINSKVAQEIIKKFHEKRIMLGTEVADGYWLARNQIIVKKCMSKAMGAKLRRIVFVFGGHHKYIIEEYLYKFYGISAKKITKLFENKNNPMPEEVILEWTKNKNGLLKIISSKSTDSVFKEMVNNSNRIKSLEKFISTKGVAH